MKCGNLNFLEPSGPLQACNGTGLPFYFLHKHGNICRWADKFCLHCNNFIYIRYIRIKPVLCSSMVSLFHHTSPWAQTLTVLTECTSKCKSFSDLQFKQCAVIEFLTAEKVPPIEIHRRIQSVYGDQCVDVSIVRRWVRWSLQWENGLWWSVCWCEYSKTLGKVKCAVTKWFVVISVLMWVQ